jgi:hypothetical protein
MPQGVRTYALALLLTLLGSAPAQPQAPWKGYSILGNGHLTAVYSDDPRITASTKAAGIQHFYFNDYTADYVASTSFELLDRSGKPLQSSGPDAVGMKNFFTAQTQTPLTNGSLKTVLCFIHPNDAAVLSVSADGPAKDLRYKFVAQLRKEIKTDQDITLTSLRAENGMAVAVWSSGVALAIVPRFAQAQVTVTESSVSVIGHPGEILLIPGSSESEVLSKAHAFEQQKASLENEAKDYWEAWMNAGQLPAFKEEGGKAAAYLEAYKRNLYCVKAANLNGQIPADITGQFLTNNMPQLYPRDAMMCARAFLATGHPAEAKQIIEFWSRHEIPMKTPGEWYARYDAHGKAVDGGSGARYDEPEWDANGYFIYLVNAYHDQTGQWIAGKNLLYSLADFLVSHLDSTGLLYEGGIVEWTGYLPATNMICAAALKTAANIAQSLGDTVKAGAYLNASTRISGALPQMFDPSRQTYADVRFAERKGANDRSLTEKSGRKVYLWDTTANVGALWGYPDHRELQLSNAFYAKNTTALGGGMRYFDSPDPGLAGYGHGLFLFTTAAAAEYQFLYGDPAAGNHMVEWMLHNANAYGLMPEHINPDGLDISPASPLSWCSAEYAITLLLASRHAR